MTRRQWLGICAAASRIRATAQTPDFRRLWHDPEVDARIRDGIRDNRMGYARVRCLDADGKPLNGVRVSVRQTSHEFLFGSNVFMLKGFDSEQKNRQWEQRYLNLCNYGTAPFYWADLEPEQGKPRFAADSKPIDRRPPPDLVVDFARKNHIRLKGHPLIWHAWIPSWLPQDVDSVERLVAKRFREIAKRYGSEIDIFDVVNEPLERPPRLVLPRDYVFWAFREAGRLFPSTTLLTLNEVTSIWTNFRRETSPFYLLTQGLLMRGAPVRALGLQFHLFSETQYAETLRGTVLRPLDLFQVLDQYADFHLPIHITEITVPTLPDSGEGRAAQAELVRNLYRLWFSHAGVEAITWWNLADGTATANENHWNGGLLDRELNPKPSYTALEQLILKEWRTEASAESGENGEAVLHGFHGRYQLVARSGGKTAEQEIYISRHGANRFEIRLH